MKKVYGVLADNKPRSIEEYDQDRADRLHFSRVLFKVVDATEHECEMIVKMLNRISKLNET